MINQWIPDAHYRNYGDAITELILDLTYERVKAAMVNDTSKLYFLIGSVIYNPTIQRALDLGYTPMFIGCGWRGDELDPELVARAKFLGCRGPRTRDALLRAGVDVPITGDSAYAAFKELNIETGREGVGTVLVPHIVDELAEQYTTADVGVDVIVDARVADAVQLLDKVDIFANAEFVLGGAMHACITAHNYGVPFAPFADGFIDCPPKWEDWLESVGIPGEKLKFCKTLDEGREWYESIVSYL